VNDFLCVKRVFVEWNLSALWFLLACISLLSFLMNYDEI